MVSTSLQPTYAHLAVVRQNDRVPAPAGDLPDRLVPQRLHGGGQLLLDVWRHAPVTYTGSVASIQSFDRPYLVIGVPVAALPVLPPAPRVEHRCSDTTIEMVMPRSPLVDERAPLRPRLLVHGVKEVNCFVIGSIDRLMATRAVPRSGASVWGGGQRRAIFGTRMHVTTSHQHPWARVRRPHSQHTESIPNPGASPGPPTQTNNQSKAQLPPRRAPPLAAARANPPRCG